MRGMAWLLPLATLMACAPLPSAPLPTMPDSLAARWLTATTVREGWNALGYDTKGWVPASYDVALGYPLWMEPPHQAIHRAMWHPGGPHTGKPVYFRRSLLISGQVVSARFQVVADNRFGFYVNGKLAGGMDKVGQTGTYDAAGLLRAGQNLLGAQATDLGGGYGLLVAGEVTQTWPFDPKLPRWRSSPKAAPGWNTLEFNDAKWKPAAPDAAPAIVLDEAGTFPCFSLPGGTINEYSSAYFRLPLSLDGLPREAELTILADDGYELFVNGRLMAVERRVAKAYWPMKVDIAEALRPGNNVIAVRVTNTWGPGRLHCVPTVTMAL